MIAVAALFVTLIAGSLGAILVKVLGG
jgi:hypothetical protein